MEFKQGFIKRQPELYYREFFKENPKGAVLIIHGSGEHIGRYEYVQKKLYENGFASLGCDLRGLGKSSGKRGHIDSFQDFLDDVYETYKLLDENYEDMPKFLIGHSMGGLIGLSFAEKYKDLFNAVFISSPFLGFKTPVSSLLKKTAETLSVLLPTVSFKTNISSNMLTRSNEIKSIYEQDQYICGTVTARWFTEISKAIENTLKNAYKLDYPLLMLQAELDMLVDPDKTLEFFNNSSSDNKEFDLVKGCYHELLNEPERDEILDRVIGFFSKNL